MNPVQNLESPVKEVPTWEGVQYPSWSAICAHLGYSYGAVATFKSSKGLSWTEALQQYQPGTFWTDKEIAILKERYPVEGMNIPSLLKTRTAKSINKKARQLGLDAPRTIWVALDGVRQTYRSAAEKLGTNPHKLATSPVYAGLSPQECIDRLRRMHRFVDGKYTTLVVSRFREDREYLHLGNELWSPSVYYDYARPEWNMYNFSYRMRERGMSADEALADVSDNFVAGVSVRGTDLVSSCYAYTTEDGVEYRVCICGKCRRTILIPMALFDNFVHKDEVCIKYEVPDSVLVGLSGRHKVRKTASKYLEEC